MKRKDASGREGKGRVRIAPSILSADFSNLAEEIRRAEKAGADAIHVDVMDGLFVPNITIGPPVVAAIRAKTTLPLDVHLMIVRPDDHLEAFARAGANVLYVHQEVCTHLHRTIGRIRELGKRPAVVLNPSTPVSAVEEILADVDRVLVMTVNPGFGGQRFIRSMLPKIARLSAMAGASKLSLEIEVDGGISPETAPEAVRAGATHLVAGKAVYGTGDVEAAMRALREAASGG